MACSVLFVGQFISVPDTFQMVYLFFFKETALVTFPLLFLALIPLMFLTLH